MGTSDDSIQTRLRGRYLLGDIIGRGGMSEVYRARDERLGRDVAVKIMWPASTSDAERQSDEVNLLARLSHSGLVTLHDAGVEPAAEGTHRIYLVMELIDGTTLAGALDAGPLPLRQVAELGVELADALVYVHGNGVVHRDVTPSNIMLVSYANGDSRTRAKLTDFGIAGLAGKGAVLADDPEKSTFTTMGTAAYLSPEQVEGQPIGTPSDVYSLGLVLLQSLTGELAFPGEQVESAVSRLDRDPVIPDSLPAGWRTLIARMTARSEEQRPGMAEVAIALRQLATDAVGRHRADVPVDDTALQRSA